MGSHYIKVGSLKIDSDLMKLICPAAGYYSDEVPPPSDPIPVLPPGEEEILLICENKLPFLVSFTTKQSGGSSVIDIYDDTDTVIRTTTIGSNGQYIYRAETDPALSKYFYMRIYPETSGASITNFAVSLVTNEMPNYPIVSAKFNTPNLVTLFNAFRNITDCKSIVFTSTLNEVLSMRSAFEKCGVTHFKFPAALPKVTTLVSAFLDSDIFECDFNHCVMDEALTFASALQNTKKLRILTFNPVVPKLTSFSKMLQGTGMKEIELNPVFGDTPRAVSFTSLAQDATDCWSLTLPDIPEHIKFSGTNMADNMPNLKIVKFRGYMDISTTPTFNNTLNIEELHYPYSTNTIILNSTSFSKTTKVIPPAVWAASNFNMSILISLLDANFPDCYADTPKYVYFLGRYIKEINLPNVAPERVIMGTAVAPLTTNKINLNWEGTVPNYNPCIVICANLSASSINAIFSRLPVLVGSTNRIDVRNCSGYAGCDKTILNGTNWGAM